MTYADVKKRGHVVCLFSPIYNFEIKQLPTYMAKFAGHLAVIIIASAWWCMSVPITKLTYFCDNLESVALTQHINRPFG